MLADACDLTTPTLHPPFGSESRWVYGYRECIELMLSQPSLSVSMEDLAIVAPGGPRGSINFDRRAEVLMNDNAISALDQLDPALFPPTHEGGPFNVCLSLVLYVPSLTRRSADDKLFLPTPLPFLLFYKCCCFTHANFV